MSTINDVASRAQVSKTTVSRYLNGKYNYMSESTKLRIEKAIKELNYRPNLVASSLKNNITKTIGIIISNIENPFYSAFVQEAEQYAHRFNYNVILCNSNDNTQKEKTYIDTLLARQVDGLLITTSGENNDLIKSLVDDNFPLILVDRKMPGIDVDVVCLDNKESTWQALDHLYRLGHRRIGLMMAHYENISSRAERLAGYKAFLQDHGLKLDPSLIWVGESTFEAGSEGAKRLLSLDNPPTAIFSTLNILTLGIIETLSASKINIPRDISLISFDDVNWTKVITPPLTVISQPIRELAITSIKRLLEHINSDKELPFEEIILPGELIIRNSTAAVSL